MSSPATCRGGIALGSAAASPHVRRELYVRNKLERTMGPHVALDGECTGGRDHRKTLGLVFGLRVVERFGLQSGEG